MLQVIMLPVLFVFVLSAVPVTAHQAPAPTLDDLPKSKAVAVGLELVCPILGYGYAGNASRGIAPALITLTGAIFITVTLDESGKIYGKVQMSSSQEKRVVWVGSAFFIGGRILALARVCNVVERHNQRLRLKPIASERLGAKLVLTF